MTSITAILPAQVNFKQVVAIPGSDGFAMRDRFK